ncbi:unnamed protein product [Leptidea sinapis]|uniref:Uncharacterized protein n=1 Tax=Leptidea sinapis TaxID=189913 RepID=A0A5E4PMS4_9NEOP|nr:unnamed protein product [Leptidea sinapis]
MAIMLDDCGILEYRTSTNIKILYYGNVDGGTNRKRALKLEV